MHIIIFLIAIKLIQTVTFVPILNIPDSNVIIDIEKAFALQRIGIYSSKLKADIVHSFMYIDNLCVASPTADVCMFTSHSTRTNILEIATISSSRDTIIALPRYDSNQISMLIRNDISQKFPIRHLDAFLTKTSSFSHLIENQFHLTYDSKTSINNSSKSLVSSGQSGISSITPSDIYTLILKQINNKKIGFDFLTDIELMPFLTSIISTIDKSYQIHDLSESLILFSKLIVAQSVHVLRSCTMNQKYSSINQPCLIISTFYLRPLLESNIAPIIYRFIPLPAVMNDEQFIYANMPELIAIDTDDQTAVLWSTVPKTNECLFSIYVYCQKKPPIIRLSMSPCLSELFNDNVRTINSCQIKRSRQIQTNIINIDSNIWIFSFNQGSQYCHLQSLTEEFNSIISIHEPSIIQTPCDHAIKCVDVVIPSVSCTNRSTLIKSSVSGKYEKLYFIPWSIQNMTKQLISTYKNTMRSSLNDIDYSKENQSTVKTTIKEIASLVLSILFLFFLSILLFFIRWIKRMVQKRLDTLEKDVDDIQHESV